MRKGWTGHEDERRLLAVAAAPPVGNVYPSEGALIITRSGEIRRQREAAGISLVWPSITLTPTDGGVCPRLSAPASDVREATVTFPAYGAMRDPSGACRTDRQAP